MAELKHAKEQPGYASVAWRNYCDTLAARVKELEAQLSAYPADWRRDSSLDSWFPYTAEEMRSDKKRIAELEAQLDELLADKKDLLFISGEKEDHLIQANFRTAVLKELAIKSLADIADWCDRYTSHGHPVSVVARKAIAKIEAEKSA